MNAVDVAIEWHPVGKSSAKISTQIGGYDEVDQLIKSFHRIFFSRYWLITAYADKLHAFWHWCEAHIVSASEKFHFFRKVKVVNFNNLMRFKVMRIWYELYSLRCWIDHFYRLHAKWHPSTPIEIGLRLFAIELRMIADCCFAAIFYLQFVVWLCHFYLHDDIAYMV